jgi:peptide-methionine (S)-S-oxide reductase
VSDRVLRELVGRVPVGWSVAEWRGRRYAVTRVDRAGGRAISVYAEELAGTDVVSTNVYLVAAGGAELRPCEMPAEKVLAFLGETRWP